MDEKKQKSVINVKSRSGEVRKEILIQIEEHINTLNGKRNNPDITYMKIIKNNS